MAIAIAKPGNFGDFSIGLDFTAEARFVADQDNLGVGAMAMGGGVDGAEGFEAIELEREADFFADFAGNGLGIGFARLALATGEVEGIFVLAASTEKLSLGDVDPTEGIDDFGTGFGGIWFGRLGTGHGQGRIEDEVEAGARKPVGDDRVSILMRCVAAQSSTEITPGQY